MFVNFLHLPDSLPPAPLVSSNHQDQSQVGPSYPPAEGPWYWEEAAPEVCLQDEEQGCDDHEIGSVSTRRDKESGIWRLELRFWRMEEGRNLGDEDLLQISDLQCQDPHCTLFLNTEMFVLWNILFLKYLE